MSGGNNDEAVAFLLRFRPEGPWVLTAINVDRKGTSTETFSAEDVPRLLKWLKQHNGFDNIYFSVNPTKQFMRSKAAREDIAAMDWLHVDIDPRVGEDLNEERERILRHLSANLPDGVPPPTVTVFSGGGYQAFWKLDKPFPIDGDPLKYEEAARYNQQIEILFGADNCHNVDRIMRLPGTMNIPDAKKKRKGREPALAKVIEFVDERVYSLGQFQPAPKQQLGGSGFSSGDTVVISGNVPRLQDLSELDQWNVPDRVKVIIAQGHHPDEAKLGDSSRSAWLFDCLCQLARCQVPPEVMYAIITDPSFPISASVVDKGANAEKYAKRQIERAMEEAVDPWLRKFNEQFAVVGNMGGKCRVVEEVMDEGLKRMRLTRISFEDFRNRYMHHKVQIGVDKAGLPIYAPAGKWWLQHEMRRQYETMVFAPGREVPGVYNLWKGFAVESRPGDCKLFLDHIFENICSSNLVYYDYLIRWMARAVQFPDTAGQVAVVLRGGRGVGKGVFANVFGALFGRHFLHITDSKHLVGSFNSHLRDCVCLFADEAFYAGDKKHESILKALITEDTLTVEAKGIDVELSPNYVHLVVCSNEDWVVPAGGDERRFFVLDVGSNRQKDYAYFEAIRNQMFNKGGLQALLHHLMTLDLKDFEVREVPQTQALMDQKLLSLTNEEEWWLNKLMDAHLLDQDLAWTEEVNRDHLLDDYVAYTRRFNINKRGNATSMGRFLQRVLPRCTPYMRIAEVEVPTGDGFVRRAMRRCRFYQISTLEEARLHWNMLYGYTRWPQNDDLQEQQKRLDSKETF